MKPGTGDSVMNVSSFGNSRAQLLATCFIRNCLKEMPPSPFAYSDRIEHGVARAFDGTGWRSAQAAAAIAVGIAFVSATSTKIAVRR